MSPPPPPPAPPPPASVAPSYPPVAFAFRLQMLGLSSQADEAGFQDVSGLGMEMETESYHEGGQNQYKHTLPTGAKGGTLVLKRGLVTVEKPLYQWCERILQGGLSSPISPATFNLQLLTPGAGGVLKSWTIHRAWPTKWSLSALNANDSQVVLESLELAYTTQIRATTSAQITPDMLQKGKAALKPTRSI